MNKVRVTNAIRSLEKILNHAYQNEGMWTDDFEEAMDCVSVIKNEVK